MGKATGIFLILAGVGTAALVLPAVDRESERQLVDVVRIATGAAAPRSASEPPRMAAIPAIKPVEQGRPKLASNATQRTEAVTRADKGDQEPAIAPPSRGIEAAQATANLAAPPMLVAPPQSVTKNGVTAPVKDDNLQARQNLARDIQRELKRVGCYDGDVSGDWNTGTRRAMKTFIDHVNAALPTDEPDHILRTMVQGHPGNACGRATMPSVTARIAPKPDPRIVDKTLEAAPSVPRDLAAARPSVPKPAWETTVAAAVIAPPVSTEGRMAIGGPAAQATGVITGSIGTANPKLVPRETTSAAVAALPAARPVTTTKRATVPGAIAALAGGNAASTSPSLPSGMTGVTTAAPNARLTRSIESRDDEVRRAAQRRAASETFKFPQPAYVGAPRPIRYYVAEPYTQRSSFGPRWFERRNLDLR